MSWYETCVTTHVTGVHHVMSASQRSAVQREAWMQHAARSRPCSGVPRTRGTHGTQRAALAQRGGHGTPRQGGKQEQLRAAPCTGGGVITGGCRRSSGLATCMHAGARTERRISDQRTRSCMTRIGGGGGKQRPLPPRRRDARLDPRSSLINCRPCVCAACSPSGLGAPGRVRRRRGLLAGGWPWR